MNYLPIALRELRVAARQRSTFWIRVGAALTGLAVGAGCLLINGMSGVRSAQMGSALFYTLTWLCLAAALGTGLFFTSDCLSEEKREGTLGLLFLTDLRGYDVAFGKLMATSLRGFFALLAVLPILAVTQLLGGISGQQYWKSSLALVDALFCSLAAGMFVSALSRDSQKALAGTLLLLLLLALGGPGADSIIAATRRSSVVPFWALSSPGYLMASATAWGRSAFWDALLVTQVLGWTMFGLACFLAPRTWQERNTRRSKAARDWTYAWKYGGRWRRSRLRRKLLELHPMAWLASRERWQSLGVWAMAVVAIAGFLVALKEGPREAWIAWNYIGGLFTLLLYLWLASQACRFFVEARRTGLMELLLAAPLTERQIVLGLWRALVRLFGLPVMLLLAVHIGGAALSQLSWHRLAARATAAAASAVGTNAAASALLTNANAGTANFYVGYTNRTVVVSGSITSTNATGTNVAGGASPVLLPPGTGREVVTTLVSTGAAALSTVANLFALCWFGMWMGMTSRTANLATLKTVLFVQIIPWFVIIFGSFMVIGMFTSRLFQAGQPANWIIWWPLLTAVFGAFMTVLKDVGFIVWSRSRLYSSLRHQAALGTYPPRTLAPAPLPAAPIPPLLADAAPPPKT